MSISIFHTTRELWILRVREKKGIVNFYTNEIKTFSKDKVADTISNLFRKGTHIWRDALGIILVIPVLCANSVQLLNTQDLQAYTIEHVLETRCLYTLQKKWIEVEHEKYEKIQ
jgi:putative flippase GtrA